MSDSEKRLPDYQAYAVRIRAGLPSKFIPIGAGFLGKSGTITVMYDEIPVTPHIVLTEWKGEKPAALNHSRPEHEPEYNACSVRVFTAKGEAKTYWKTIGGAYTREGYISVFLDAIPTCGKIVLCRPDEK